MSDEQQRRRVGFGCFGGMRIYQVWLWGPLEADVPGFLLFHEPYFQMTETYIFLRTTNHLEADIWLVLTCSIREGAETKGSLLFIILFETSA